METFFLISAIILLLIVFMSAFRVFKGPSVYDRMVGINAIATKTIVLICFIGFIYGRMDMFVDITLAYAILGFLGSMMTAKYLAVNKTERKE